VDNSQQAVANAEQTPLAESLRAPSVEDYCGALTIPFFDGTDVETHAFLHDCGVFDAGFTSRIGITGEDQVRWLNGMVTNSAQALTPGTRNYNFVLNAQGRIQGDLYAYRRAGDFVLETTQVQRDVLLAWFDRYIIMDDVELSSLDGELTAVGIAGPAAAATLAKIGLSAEGLSVNTFVSRRFNEGEVTLCFDDDTLVPRYEIWVSPAHVASLWSALRDAGATACGTRAIETLRILTGVPRYGADIRDRDLPQETNQTRALHFAKGCYLGQEIVERIRSRGAVHRSFGGFVLTETDAAPGAALSIDGKRVGELTSVANLADGRRVALGYARREFIERDATFNYDGGTAKTASLPFQLFLE
jgi:aminomethyltransferase